MTGRPHPLISRAARDDAAGRDSDRRVPRAPTGAPGRRPALDQQPLSCLPMPTQLLFISGFFCFRLSTERIDASYFKAPLATSKSDRPLLRMRGRYLSVDAVCRQWIFNISFAIIDIKCVQIYDKFEAKEL